MQYEEDLEKTKADKNDVDNKMTKDEFIATTSSPWTSSKCQLKPDAWE